MFDKHFKMLVTDVDGTLTKVGGFNVLARTRRLLGQLRESGVTVVIATGRSPVMTLQKYIGGVFADYYVTANGACVLDAKRQVVSTAQLSLSDVHEIIEFADRADAIVGFSFVDGYYIYNGFPRLEHERRYNRFMQTCYLDGSARTRHKSELPFAGIAHLDERQVQMFAPSDPDVKLVRFADGMYDIIKSEITKATAIEELHALTGTDWAHTVAIGDSENDLPMLERAGVSVAMAIAPDHIKNKCHLVTDSAERGGVYKAIKEIFF